MGDAPLLSVLITAASGGNVAGEVKGRPARAAQAPGRRNISTPAVYPLTRFLGSAVIHPFRSRFLPTLHFARLPEPGCISA